MDSDARDWIYQQYVANSLNALPERKQIPHLLKDLVYPKPVDNRTAKEITEDFCKRTGIKIID